MKIIKEIMGLIWLILCIILFSLGLIALFDKRFEGLAPILFGVTGFGILTFMAILYDPHKKK